MKADSRKSCLQGQISHFYFNPFSLLLVLEIVCVKKSCYKWGLLSSVKILTHFQNFHLLFELSTFV